LPDFRLLRPIARGGMGTVYEAYQESLGRRVAVKIRSGRISSSDQARFLREQQVLAQLHQTHIVPIHTAGQVGLWQYFAMAYIEGAPLNQVVAAALRHALAEGGKTPTLAELAAIVLASPSPDGRTAETAALVGASPGLNDPSASEIKSAKLTLSARYLRSVAEVMADAAEALDHAHQAGILHRDIKPSNLMVDTEGHCWLVDFGLARWHGESSPGHLPRDDEAMQGAALTRGPMGTPEYMSPEQHDGQADVRSDVWALGATLFELLCLRPAFSGATYAAIRNRVLEGDAPSLDELADGLPADLAAICRKCLNARPQDRYPTAAAFAEDLRRWLGGEPTVARPARALRRGWLWARRNKGWAAFFAASVVGILALAGIGLIVEKNSVATARAEAEAAQAREQDHERELLVQQLQRSRLSTRRSGWRDEGWRKIEDVVAIRGGQDVATEVGALMAGLDARVVKQFPFPAASLAFDSTGQRLLIGGASDSAGRPQTNAKVWDRSTDSIFPDPDAVASETEIFGESLVAFGADGLGLQLVAKDAVTLELSSVGQQGLRREFKLSEDGQPRPLTAWSQPRLAISSDGAIVAGGTNLPDVQAVSVYESANGRVLRRIETAATALAISPDGKLLAVGDDEGRISLFSLANSDPPVVLERGRTRIHSLNFARDPWRHTDTAAETADENGELILAAGDAGGMVTIWDVARRAPRTLCGGSVRDIYAVAFSPDVSLLAAAGRSQVTLWDAATGRLLLYLPDQDYVAGLAFSPDGRWLAVASQTQFFAGAVSIYELSDGAGIQTLRGLAGQIERPCLSPEGRLVAAIAHDWQVAVWDRATGHLLHVLDAPRGMFADNADVAFSPDGAQLMYGVSNLREGTLCAWDMQTGRQVGSWTIAPGLQNQFAFAPDGRLLHFQVETKDGRNLPVTAANFAQHPRVCRIRELHSDGTAKVIAEIDTFRRHVFTTQADPQGRFFVIQGVTGPDASDRAVAIIDSLDGSKLLHIPMQDTAAAALLALDPTGQLLAYRPGNESFVKLIELPGGQVVDTLPSEVLVVGPRAELWCEAKSRPPYGCALYRRGDDTPLATLGVDASGMVLGAEFDASGTHLACGNPDGTVSLCDLQELKRRLTSFGLRW
jgi:serine/threonine protein kinase/WD40 repeat protein